MLCIDHLAVKNEQTFILFCKTSLNVKYAILIAIFFTKVTKGISLIVRIQKDSFLYSLCNYDIDNLKTNTQF